MEWAVAAVAVSAIAVAQNAGTVAKTADEAKITIEARQSVFKDIKKAMDPMSAMLRRQREIDTAVVATNAEQIKALAQKIPAQFAVNTHAFKPVKTLAREGIWTSQADFKTKADALVNASLNLAIVAKGGDKGATLKAIADMGKTCGGCHDNYKDKDES